MVVSNPPVRVGSPTINGVAANLTLAMPKPTVGVTVQNDDCIVMILRAQAASATDWALAGFQRAGSTWGVGDRLFGLYYHRVTDATTEPANYNFVQPAATRAVGIGYVLRGVDWTDPIGGGQGYAVMNGTVPGYTADDANGLYLVIAGSDERTAGQSLVLDGKPAGYSLIAELQSTLNTVTTGSRTAVSAFEKTQQGSATVAASTMGYTAFTTPRQLYIAFRGKPLPAPVGLPVKLQNGSAARLSVVNAAGVRKSVTSIKTFRQGFNNVTALLNKFGATWAHRGGSSNFPEMSEYAYDQSALLGHGCLEFSCSRASDGWWFGLHDDNFDRTSQVTGSSAPESMTKSAILATYQNTLRAGSIPRPYYGLIEFLDKYTPRHVVVVDPKTAANIPEFLNILDAHGGPSKIIVKFFGSGSGSAAIADAATARGYQTWGYFYQGDYDNGDMATWQSHWSILGMAYGANSAAWTAVRSYGKKVVGHIATTQANYNTAIAMGADMVQCGGVVAINAIGPYDTSPTDPFPDVVEHNVFGNADHTSVFGVYSDGGADSWLGNQFYTTSPAPTMQVVGVRVFAAGGMIGQTGNISIIRRAAGSGGVFDATTGQNPWSNGAEVKAMGRNLVAGWNDFYLTTPITMANLDGVVACYNVNGWYLYASDNAPYNNPNVIKTADSVNLFYAEMAIRSFYAAAPGVNLDETSSRGYGIDIIVRE